MDRWATFDCYGTLVDWNAGIGDRDLVEAPIEALGVPFERTIVAGEIGSYKPAPGHWEVFYGTTGADRRGHAHVALSIFHDIQPASELEIYEKALG